MSGKGLIWNFITGSHEEKNFTKQYIERYQGSMIPELQNRVTKQSYTLWQQNFKETNSMLLTQKNKNYKIL